MSGSVTSGVRIVIRDENWWQAVRDGEVGYPSRHPTGQSILRETANNHDGGLARFDRSFGRDIRVTPSATQGNYVAD